MFANFSSSLTPLPTDCEAPNNSTPRKIIGFEFCCSILVLLTPYTTQRHAKYWMLCGEMHGWSSRDRRAYRDRDIILNNFSVVQWERAHSSCVCACVRWTVLSAIEYKTGATKFLFYLFWFSFVCLFFFFLSCFSMSFRPLHCCYYYF